MTDTSQWGESKILADLFAIIGEGSKTFVDIGAWDGKHLSNTYDLRRKGWKGVYAESNEERRNQIEPGCHVFGHCHSIDSMLSMYPDIPVNFDLLCIDVDGDDYYLWEDMQRYQPRVVVIEYNQTVPVFVNVRQKIGGSFGASALALYELALCKAYVLVGITTTNMIFLHKSNMNYKKINEINITKFNTDWLQFIITGYNGKQYVIGNPAHNDNQNGQHEELITDIEYRKL